MFAGYLGDDAATAAAYTDDGWFRTGDRVRLDEEGTITFVERDKDVLKVGGENVGAPEIERVLLSVPGVVEAAVVGRPDPMLGDVPVAFVVVSDGTVVVAAIEAACEASLPSVQAPARDPRRRRAASRDARQGRQSATTRLGPRARPARPPASTAACTALLVPAARRRAACPGRKYQLSGFKISCRWGRERVKRLSGRPGGRR